MLNLQFIPKPYRSLAIIAGAAIAGLTIYKYIQEIKINKERLDDYKAAE